MLAGREGGRGQYSLYYAGELLKVLLSSQQAWSPSHPHTSLHSHFVKSQLSISSGQTRPVFGVVWSGLDWPVRARCEVTCFDVHYGNLGQTHSVQVET